jgi:hypothetical protein
MEVRVVLGVVVRVETPVRQVLQTLAVEAVQGVMDQMVARAVQALSFFATPVQFNISLVAQQSM